MLITNYRTRDIPTRLHPPNYLHSIEILQFAPATTDEASTLTSPSQKKLAQRVLTFTPS
jgi:hypothetical protein